MGFEQTILEILSIIRGTPLPGLKRQESSVKGEGVGEEGGGGNKAKVVTTLDQKWRAQAVTALKTCEDIPHLHYIMASATLNKGVRELALPVMGACSFYVVDADAETVDLIHNAEDLLKLEKMQKKQESVCKQAEVVNGILCFPDDDEVERNKEPLSDEPAGKRRQGLDEGETMLAPSQLRQFSMLVSCKWRLAALVSFLRVHAAQKVVVFFSTCDAVDFHALLFRNATWPLDLDPAITTTEEEVTSSSTSASQKRSAVLDPLPPKFTGMFGSASYLYRLHGNVPQKVRQEVYRDFCAASSGILLCTDVAARGLDLPRVDWILQYDPPCETVRPSILLIALLYSLHIVRTYVDGLCT